ncbi:LexA family protein [Hafnia psychrotolerans]|uniref:Repressor n=1 Tax=Hafnia psychrotolerans TaxID=1477018 RepID=A0ABQ1G7T8_9GAMM|nr:XRE family transcriptional regulator [Hafnia psychrotolerans]GGA38455.1 repressor [Hafnia psychrotolerans]
METKDIRRANLAALLKTHLDKNPGSTRAEFAELCGLAPAQLSQLTGEKNFRNIGGNLARKIEDSLGLQTGWLDSLRTEIPENKNNISYIGVRENKGNFPLISWVSAGSWLEAVEPYRKEEIEVWPETTVDASEGSFWLRVKGDSMTSPVGFTVPEGVIILVDPGKEAVSGKLVVAKLENENEATFKQFMVDAGRKYLKALNPHHPPTIVNGNCKIIGVVVDVKWEHIP